MHCAQNNLKTLLGISRLCKLSAHWHTLIHGVISFMPALFEIISWKTMGWLKELFFSIRLLDICHGQRREREMSLYLVFEHVHQDLASYLEKCPPPGLPQDRIKVNTSHSTVWIIFIFPAQFFMHS